MSQYTFFWICVQLCLLQNVYSQCRGAGWPNVPPGYGFDEFGPRGYGLNEPVPWGYPINEPALAPWEYGFAEPALAPRPYPLGEPALAPWNYGPVGRGAIDAYGGEGIGDVTVEGEIPAAGATVVGGQVPVLGGVEFSGLLPAAGAITIAGSCSCGCSGHTGGYHF